MDYKLYLISELKDLEDRTKVRIVGYVLDKFISKDEKFGYIILMDDSFGKVKVKFFDERVKFLKTIKITELIEVYGYKKENSVIASLAFKRLEEEYLLFLIRKLGGLKELVEKKEELEFKPATEVKEEEIKRVITLPNSEGLDEKVYNYIKQNPSCTIEQMEKDLKIPRKELEDVLLELLARGEIYEPKPGRFEVV